jgi:sulfate adenylyltransferase subunit 1 (EFTu-like GTPase family)
MALAKPAEIESTVVLLMGEVDHGKSSLVGRLLVESHLANDLQLKRVGSQSPNFAHLLDALGEERSDERTVGLTRLTMHFPAKSVLFLDAPGHQEFLRSVVTGLSVANIVLLVVAADSGITETLERQIELLKLFPKKEILLAITKLDLMSFPVERMTEISQGVSTLLDGNHPQLFTTSSLSGVGISELREGILNRFREASPKAERFRMWVQGQIGEVIYGTPYAGSCMVGDKLTVSNGETIVVNRIETLSGLAVHAGDPCRIFVEGAKEVSRGSLIGDEILAERKVEINFHCFESHELKLNHRYLLRVGTSENEIQMESISSIPGRRWTKHAVCLSSSPIALDRQTPRERLPRCLIESCGRAVAVGELASG